MESKSALSDVNENKLLKVELFEILNGCRVCMGWSGNMKPIFGSEDHDIVEKVEFCTGLQLKYEEGLPSNICDICLNNLSVAHSFKNCCLNSDQVLKSLHFESVIKKETDYNEDRYEYSDADDDRSVLQEMLMLNDATVKNEPNCVHLISDDEVIRKAVKRNVSEKKTRGPYNKDPKRRQRSKKFKFKRLYCEACDMKFVSKTEHETHKQELHKDCENGLCELCGKVFTNKYILHSHMKAHLPPAFGCAHCDYRSTNKSDLKKHVRRHTGEKTYQCQYCSSSYYTSSNLTSHIQRSHEKLKPHQCHRCEKAFFDRTKLNRHLDSHNNIKRFECEHCHSSYTRRCHWKKHLLKQHGVELPTPRPGRKPLNLIMKEMKLLHGNSFGCFTKTIF